MGLLELLGITLRLDAAESAIYEAKVKRRLQEGVTLSVSIRPPHPAGISKPPSRPTPNF